MHFQLCCVQPLLWHFEWPSARDTPLELYRRWKPQPGRAKNPRFCKVWPLGDKKHQYRLQFHHFFFCQQAVFQLTFSVPPAVDDVLGRLITLKLDDIVFLVNNLIESVHCLCKCGCPEKLVGHGRPGKDGRRKEELAWDGWFCFLFTCILKSCYQEVASADLSTSARRRRRPCKSVERDKRLHKENQVACSKLCSGTELSHESWI